MSHDHKTTHMLHLHGLNVYLGHLEPLASGIILPMCVPGSLDLPYLPASAKASYWRALCRATKLWLVAEHRDSWHSDSRMGRHMPGDSTAASIAASVGFEAFKSQIQPYIVPAFTELREDK